MKIPEYENVNLTGDELFLVEDADGTATIKARNIFNSSNILETLLNDPALPVPMRRNIYRGKNLGTSVTEEQKKAIRDGTFEGLAIGDYWMLNDNRYLVRIMDFNYYKFPKYSYNNNGLQTHELGTRDNHVVIIPDVGFTEAYLGGYAPNPVWTKGSDYLETGYANCIFRDYVMNSRLLDLSSLYGSTAAISKIYYYLSSTINTTGHVNAVKLVSDYVMLPTSMMIFGNGGSSTSNPGRDDSTNVNDYGRYALESTQLAGFRLNPGLIPLLKYSSYYEKLIMEPYWLREPVAKNLWAVVDVSGMPGWRKPGTDLASVREVYCLNGNW